MLARSAVQFQRCARTSGRPLDAAAALAFARETARIALRTEVRFVFSTVQVDHDLVDASLIFSIFARDCPERSGRLPQQQLVVTPFTQETDLSPSRSSSASREPVEAPDGQLPYRRNHLPGVASASTVGLPRESMISRPMTLTDFGH